jgi:type VI secretion system protein ImpM
MSAADLNTGFFGKIPATGDFVAWNLPRTFIDRWDRWMSMELRARPDEGELDPRAWRFVVPAGIFSDQPCAGVWRMSEDRVGRRYPFAIVRLGPPPDPADPWFDATAKLVRGAVDELRTFGWIGAQIPALPQPQNLESRHRIAFWLDDWEVQELSFSDIHDLAVNGLPAMRAARVDPEVK